jgi:membrane protein required for colicin V production
VDAGIAIVVLLSALFAYSRGFTKEVFTLGIWVVAALAALNFYPVVEPVIRDVVDLGDLTPWAAIAIAFVIALIILSIVGSVISSAIRNSALGPIDKGLGFLFGVARGLVLLALAWILFEGSNPAVIESEAIQTSYGGKIVADTAAALREAMPTEMPNFLQTAMADLFDKAPGSSTAPVNELVDPAPINN